MNSNTVFFPQELARVIDGSVLDNGDDEAPWAPMDLPPLPRLSPSPAVTADEFEVRKAKAIAEHEVAKAKMFEMRARVAAAIETAKTPADQIALAENVPLILNRITGRFSVAPYVELPPDMIFPVISPDWMLNNNMFQTRAAAGCQKTIQMLANERARLTANGTIDSF
jgi:hypothetical protein